MKEEEEQAAKLHRLQGVWEAHAKDDPLWAILSIPEKKGGKWGLQEFLRTGVLEIERVKDTLTAHGIEVSYATALDFGCGVGRLSQALCGHFERITGVDISPTMIRTAKQLNQYPEKCEYLLNSEEHLRIFDDNRFTFIYSNVVLQHMEPEIAKSYLTEFTRILRPGGLLVFQLPSSYKQEEGLPPNAWVASIDCPQQSLSWGAGGSETLTVRVTNSSTAVWCATGQCKVMLGNHWLDEQGGILRLDDGRAMLPNKFAPGQQVQLHLQVETPPARGRYFLELDLVQEGVAWFKDKGSVSLRLPIEIFSDDKERSSDELATSTDKTAPLVQDAPVFADDVFEGFSMHLLPRGEVVRLLYERGCRLEFIEPSDSGGPGYQSYLYFVRKSEASR